MHQVSRSQASSEPLSDVQMTSFSRHELFCRCKMIPHDAGLSSSPRITKSLRVSLLFRGLRDDIQPSPPRCFVNCFPSSPSVRAEVNFNPITHALQDNRFCNFISITSQLEPCLTIGYDDGLDELGEGRPTFGLDIEKEAAGRHHEALTTTPDRAVENGVFDFLEVRSTSRKHGRACVWKPAVTIAAFRDTPFSSAVVG